MTLEEIDGQLKDIVQRLDKMGKNYDRLLGSLKIVDLFVTTLCVHLVPGFADAIVIEPTPTNKSGGGNGNETVQ